MENVAAIAISVFVSIILYIVTVVRTLSWIMAKLDKRVDEKIMLSPDLARLIDERVAVCPFLQDYQVLKYTIEELKPDIKEIHTDIQEIKMKLKTSAKDRRAAVRYENE